MQGLLKNTLVLLILSAIFVTMNIGSVLTSDMMMQDGAMMPCPYMGVATLCNMTPLEHMNGWKLLFVATLEQLVANMSLLLLLLAVLCLSVFRLFNRDAIQKTRVLYRQRYREKIFDPFRLAFARGVIHSKAF